MEERYNGLVLFPNNKPQKFGLSEKIEGKKDINRFKRFAFSSLTGKKKMKGIREKFAASRTRATLRSRSKTRGISRNTSFYTRSMDVKRDIKIRGRPLSSQVIVLDKRAAVSYD